MRTSKHPENEFKQWLDRAENFHHRTVRSLRPEAEAAFTRAPSATEQSIASVESRLGQPLPKALREFFLNGTADLEMSYSWETDEARREAVEELIDGTTVSGGGTIRLNDLPKHKEDARAWAEETWLAEEPDQQELWLKSLPFLHLDNGDYLALDLRQPTDDSPVLYLSHDDESQTIASSFTGFLQAWERVCYLGPESWLLEPFIDPETGLLDGEGGNAQKLRRLFDLKA
jgi:cell wall assembly regulator SMI1